MGTILDTNPDWEKDEDGVWHYKNAKSKPSTTGSKSTDNVGLNDGYKNWESNYGSHKGSSYSYGTGSVSTGKWACNHKPKEVKVGTFSLWPTKESEVDAKFLQTLDVICPLTEYGSAKEAYNDFCGLIMWIPIKDYGVPSVGRLITNARRINQFASSGARVGLWCVGSHGRTGLVLATCIGLAEPDVDPIDAVRERHCKHCVETQSQIEMVFKALGRELPEKWKPSTATTATTPLWVQEGKAWSPASESAAEGLLSAGVTTCDLCIEGPSLTSEAGKGPLHWFGQILAHDSCYADAIAKADADKAMQTKLPDTTSAQTSSNVEPLVPTNDTTNATALTVATKTREQAQTDGDIIDEEHFKAAVASTRPFQKHWPVKRQKKFADLLNKKDHFGDYICPQCKLLIIKPFDADIMFSTKNPEKRWAQHRDCEAAKVDPDAHPLCEVCYDGMADEDGFCSEKCLFEKMNTYHGEV